MSLNQVVNESINAYKPTLDKLSTASKIELYNAIHYDLNAATDEMLSLGVALTADPGVQSWLNAKLLLPKP